LRYSRSVSSIPEAPHEPEAVHQAYLRRRIDRHTDGIFHHLWWLIVPPVAFGAYFFGTVASHDAYRRQLGGAAIMPSMLVPNIMVTAWNSAIQSALFFVGWAMSLFFS
jgi:hypothetical protein